MMPTSPLLNGYNDQQRHDSRRQGELSQSRNKHVCSSVFWAQLNTIFLRFSKRSTIHGLNHLAQAKSAKRRIFWILTTLVASFGFFTNLYYLFEKYFQNPILTNVYHDYTGFIYPDITFCLINPIYFPPKDTVNFSKLIELSREYIRFTRDERGGLSRRIKLADYLYINQTDSYSHRQWMTIVSCKYMNNECSWHDFELRRLWPYGNCFTFNPQNISKANTRNILQSMQYNGFRPDFRLIIYKGLYRPKQFKLDPHNSILVPNGVMVMIHEAGTFPLISDSFIVDECTQIDLKITIKSHLNSFKNCKSYRDKYTYIDVITGRSKTFIGRQSDCIFKMIQKEIVQYCNCSWQFFPIAENFADLPFCYNPNIFTFRYLFYCMRNAFANIRVNDLATCYVDLCNHTSYTTVVSQSRFPAVRERNTQKQWLEQLSIMEEKELQFYNTSDLARKALNLKDSENISIQEAYRSNKYDLLNINFVENNFMMLRIVPSSLFMDLVEESSEYPLSRLLSDIGGCVGLWIGASLITLFEFVDLLLDFIDANNYRQQRRASNFHSRLPNHSNRWTNQECADQFNRNDRTDSDAFLDGLNLLMDDESNIDLESRNQILVNPVALSMREPEIHSSINNYDQYDDSVINVNRSALENDLCEEVDLKDDKALYKVTNV